MGKRWQNGNGKKTGNRHKNMKQMTEKTVKERRCVKDSKKMGEN